MIRHPNLLAYYPFEGNANDVSGNGHHGSVNGATLVAAKMGRGYSFDGNDKITLPDTFNLVAYQDQSICGWFNTDSVTPTIIYDGRNRAIRGYFVGVTNDPSNILRAWLYIGSAAVSLRTSTAISAETWYHFAVTIDRDGLMSLYLDAELKSTVDISAYNASDLSSNVAKVIGAKSYSGSSLNPFNGDLDEIMLFDKVLPQSDISRIMMGLHPISI